MGRQLAVARGCRRFLFEWRRRTRGEIRLSICGGMRLSAATASLRGQDGQGRIGCPAPPGSSPTQRPAREMGLGIQALLVRPPKAVFLGDFGSDAPLASGPADAVSCEFLPIQGGDGAEHCQSCSMVGHGRFHTSLRLFVECRASTESCTPASPHWLLRRSLSWPVAGSSWSVVRTDRTGVAGLLAAD